MTEDYRPLFDPPEKDYILDGCKGRKPRIIKTLHLQPADALVEVNRRLVAKYQRISGELKLSEEFHTDDARLIVSAYGITAQISKGAVLQAREKGLKVGLIRPITLWPFPDGPFIKAAKTAEKFLVVEMSNGQMVEDVRLAQQCRRPVEFFGVGGGWYPTIEEVLEAIEKNYPA